MKTILASIFFLVISTFATAQLAMAELSFDKAPIIEATSVLSEAEKLKIAKKQNESVTNQLQAYLKEQLNYSEAMKDNCMEGEVLVQINISDKGIITAYKVVKSPKAEMTEVMLKMMEGLKVLEIAESTYYGHKKVRIPVDFSIK